MRHERPADLLATTEPWIATAAVSTYGDPIPHRALLEDLSALEDAAALAAPLRLVHGRLDTKVPYTASTQFLRRGSSSCYACYASGRLAAVTTISHRELRNNSAEILRRVAAGERFEVTNHGEIVAELSPPSTASELDRLRAAGRTRRPTKSWSEPWVAPRPTAEVSTADMIADLRGDR